MLPLSLTHSGSCWPAEWGAGDFTWNWSWCCGLFAPKEGLPVLVSLCVCAWYYRNRGLINMSLSTPHPSLCLWIQCVFVLTAESQALLQERPSLWLRGAHPVFPSKHRLERCLLMTTTPRSCQMDCWVNTQRTAVRSPTESQSSTKSLATLERALVGPLLHFLQV